MLFNTSLNEGLIRWRIFNIGMNTLVDNDSESGCITLSATQPVPYKPNPRGCKSRNNANPGRVITAATIITSCFLHEADATKSIACHETCSSFFVKFQHTK